MNLGEKILEARKKKGYTQKELGSLLNVSDKVISKRETNKSIPDIEMIKKISTVLEISLNDLFDSIDTSETNSQSIVKNKVFNFIKLTFLFVGIILISIIFYYSGKEIADKNAYFDTTIFAIFKLIKNVLVLLSCLFEVITIADLFLNINQKKLKPYQIVLIAVFVGIFVMIAILAFCLGEILF